MLTLHSRILQTWNDSRLAWNIDSYEGIKMINVPSESIWVPKIFLNDSHFGYGLGECESIECSITFKGFVSCQFPCVQNARCIGNFSDWPVDISNCSVVFKTSLTEQDINFDHETLEGIMEVTSNNKFKIIKSKLKIYRNDRTMITFQFDMQRHSESIYRHVHVLTYILATTTLSVFWVEVQSPARLILCGVNFFLHLSLMDRVWWQWVEKFEVNQGIRVNKPSFQASC